jgi:hypothetical protein
VRIGSNDFTVKLNSLPERVAAFNNLPIKQSNGTTVYIARYDEDRGEETLSGFCLLFAALSSMLKA